MFTYRIHFGNNSILVAPLFQVLCGNVQMVVLAELGHPRTALFHLCRSVTILLAAHFAKLMLRVLIGVWDLIQPIKTEIIIKTRTPGCLANLRVLEILCLQV